MLKATSSMPRPLAAHLPPSIQPPSIQPPSIQPPSPNGVFMIFVMASLWGQQLALAPFPAPTTLICGKRVPAFKPGLCLFQMADLDKARNAKWNQMEPFHAPLHQAAAPTLAKASSTEVWLTASTASPALPGTGPASKKHHQNLLHSESESSNSMLIHH